jgi:hypothetical protein
MVLWNLNFHDVWVIYGQWFLALGPSSKLEDFLLSSVHDCFTIFSAVLFNIYRYLEQLNSSDHVNYFMSTTIAPYAATLLGFHLIHTN